MRFPSRSQLIIAGLSVMGCSAHAQCPPKSIDFEIVLEATDPSIDVSETTEALRAKFPVAVPKDVIPAGAFESNTKSRVTVSASSKPAASGERCWFPERVDVKISYRPVIWVAREWAADPCLHNAALDHFRKYDILERSFVVPALVDRLKQHSTDWLDELPSPGVFTSKDDFDAKSDVMLNILRDRVSAITEPWNHERLALHRRLIETPDASKRLGQNCKEALSKVLKRPTP